MCYAWCVRARMWLFVAGQENDMSDSILIFQFSFAGISTYTLNLQYTKRISLLLHVCYRHNTPTGEGYRLSLWIWGNNFWHSSSIHFCFQRLSVRGWTSAFLLAVHRLCGAVKGRLSHFLPCWLRTGWQSVISQGKSLETLCLHWELNPDHREAVRYIHSSTELSWPGPQRGQTVRCIHSSTELSWSGPQRGQTVRYTHSPTELSWPQSLMVIIIHKSTVCHYSILQ